jgi:ornithine cyclodeaminase/alanine dehydrogenase-like protein (mu-crystallin family)
MRVIPAEEIRERLTFPVCIPVVRNAMIAFSQGETRQLLRSIIHLADGHAFGVMPGAMGERAIFGAKLVSVFPENFATGLPSHQGVVVLFDGDSGKVACIADATEITAIRTAAASAAATGALARPGPSRLAIFGYGEQAVQHLRAIAHVRPITHATVWGRDPARAAAFATRMSAELGFPITAISDGRAAAQDADIVCTVTNAKEPILFADWLKPGAHVNVVGSSYAGPVEVDYALVARSRFIADSREGILAQGAEFIAAKAAGLVEDDHVVGEIGQVFAGTLAGRQSPDQLTIYKSIGHIVQDLAAVSALI